MRASTHTGVQFNPCGQITVLFRPILLWSGYPPHNAAPDGKTVHPSPAGRRKSYRPARWADPVRPALGTHSTVPSLQSVMVARKLGAGVQVHPLGWPGGTIKIHYAAVGRGLHRQAGLLGHFLHYAGKGISAGQTFRRRRPTYRGWRRFSFLHGAASNSSRLFPGNTGSSAKNP